MMRKKLLAVSLIILLFTSIFTLSVKAAITSATCTLTAPKDVYTEGDTVVVTFRLSNLEANRGINAWLAKLEYDTTNLKYISSKGLGNWSDPEYYAGSGMMISDIKGENFSALDGEDLCTITFEVIGKNAQDVNIEIKEIELANGTSGRAEPVRATIDIVTTGTPSPSPSTSPSPSPSQSPSPSPSTSPSPSPSQSPNPSPSTSPSPSPSGAPSPSPSASPSASPSQSPSVTPSTSPSGNGKTPTKLPQTGENGANLIWVWILIPIITLIAIVSYLKLRHIKK